MKKGFPGLSLKPDRVAIGISRRDDPERREPYYL